MVARPRKRLVRRKVVGRKRKRQRGAGVFNDVILPNLPELHYRGFDTGFKKYNFAGPGTRLDRRLNPDGTPKEWSKPVNRVDEAAYHHDLAYEKHKDLANRQAADRAMIDSLEKVRKDSNARWTERLDAGIVEAAIRAKVQLGINKKKPLSAENVRIGIVKLRNDLVSNGSGRRRRAQIKRRHAIK